MKGSHISRLHLGGAVLALTLVAGCGGGGGGVGSTPAPAPGIAPTPTTSPTPTPTPTATATPAATFQTAEYNRSTGPAQHGAIAAWQTGASGQGVTIGIVDTGIDTANPEFAGRIASASRDVAGNRGVIGEDDHGTNVALVAAAARDNTGMMGIAFNSTIAMFRADSPGSCATENAADPDSGCSFGDNDIARGIDGAVAAGAKVINLSLGGGSPNLAVRSAISRAAGAGVVIVVSAGNDGDSTEAGIDPNNPDPFAAGLRLAGSGNVIIAGSVDKNDQFSAFSNRAGTEAQWFLSARGERVCCVYKDGVLETVTNADGSRSVFVFSGTSFSAPQIAGAAALLIQAFPNLSAQQVVDLLLRSAKDGGTAGTDTTFGRGILDIAAAFAPQGTTTLAGSTTAVTLGSTTGVTSGAMGDATKTGSSLGAVVLDSYGRAYVQDFGAGVKGAAIERKLTPALTAQTRNVAVGEGAMSLAFAVDASGRVSRLPWQGQLRLSRADAEVSNVLAARVAARISPKTQLGFALRQGSDGLVAQLQGRSQPAFLVAGSPLDDLGFSQSGEASFALRQSLGAWGLTASMGRGAAMSGAPVEFGADLAGRDRAASADRFGLAFDRRFGALDTTLGANWLAERRSVLGARFAGTLGQPGADSLFLDAGLGWQPDPRWRLGGALRAGQTWVRGSGAASRLTSSGWSVDATRLGVFAADDSLALRLSQPLRVESGSIGFLLPVAYDYATLQTTMGVRRLSLTPQGREIDAELAWRGWLLGGSGSASVYYRKDPGHYAAMPDDKGLALRWVRQF